MADSARLRLASEPGPRTEAEPRQVEPSPILTLRSEFASVSVQIVGKPGCERLRIEDIRSGQTVHVDALELESLAWCRHRDLDRLLDPSSLRWPSE